MKTVSAGLATHLAGQNTTLATCWLCTRQDGTVFGFTDHDRDLVVSSVTYEAASGYTRTAIANGAALAVDNLDLEGALSSGSITDADLRAGLWDYCEVRIFQVNWADLTQGQLKLRKGRLGRVSAGRLSFNAELRGLMQHLQQEIGRIIGPDCDADLGDSRCGVVVSGSPTSQFEKNVTVTAVTSKRVFKDSARLEAAGWFQYGKLTWLTGNNAGLAMEVKAFGEGSPSDGTFELVLPMPYTIQVGDTAIVHAGCDKSLATCKAKFNNVVNFQGFPHVPGTRQVVSGGL